MLNKKKKAYESLNLFNDKTKRVIDNYYYVKNKRTRVKSQQCWLIANEVVNIAIENKCKEIHLENLSWLESSAGKWNFSEIQKRIEEKAISFGIKVIKVNACNTSKTHPITNEIGKLENRKIVFTQGEEWDRDFIAAINIAKRNKGSKKEAVVRKIRKVKTKKFKPLKSNKKEIRDKVNKIKGNMQIVVFLPNVDKSGNPELLVWPLTEVLSQEYSFVQKYKELQFWGTISYDFGEWDKIDNEEEFLNTLFKELYRILKKSGTVICFYDLWKITTLAEVIKNIGFKQLRFGEWIKSNPVPINSKVNYLTNSREIFISAVKGVSPTFNLEYNNGVYSYPIYQGKDRFHPTQKPLNLFIDLINIHSKKEELVLDCFLGSGTTAIAAIKTNRKFIGWELNKEYYEKALERIKIYEIKIYDSEI